jgi:hypothetical protein
VRKPQPYWALFLERLSLRQHRQVSFADAVEGNTMALRRILGAAI